MARDVEVPNVGESVSSGVIAAWLKQDGDSVSEGDEIFELETDKATLAVPSPGGGVLKIVSQEGEEVEVGQVVARLEVGAGEGRGASDSGAGSQGQAAGTSSAKDAGGAQDLSPAVRRIVEEHGLDPAAIEGTGKDGRITKGDALAAAESAKRGGKEEADKAADGSEAGTAGKPGAPPKGGAAAKGDAKKPAAPAPQGKTGRTGPLPAGTGQRREPMTNLRKRIAANMVASKQGSAHLTTFNEVDLSAIQDIRKKYRDAFEKRHGVRLGFMSFFVKAAQRALERYPEVNAFVDDTDVIYNDYYDIGVALSADRGLIVPVIREVDTKSFAEIESDIVAFAQRAKDKRLSPDDLVGGTFTISNGGVFGSLLSTPIPNPPQTAAMGMHSIQKRPVVVDDEIVVRPMMYLALTYDHRILDGREAIGFLKTIKDMVEDPAQLMLDI